MSHGVKLPSPAGVFPCYLRHYRQACSYATRSSGAAGGNCFSLSHHRSVSPVYAGPSSSKLGGERLMLYAGRGRCAEAADACYHQMDGIADQSGQAVLDMACPLLEVFLRLASG